MEQLVENVTPAFAQLLSLVIVVFISIATAQLRKVIKAQTTKSQRATIITLAEEVVDYVAQVGRRNGAEANGELWSMAVNLLLSELAEEGIQISEDTADLHVEAAYNRKKAYGLLDEVYREVNR